MVNDVMTVSEARGLLALRDAERRRCDECGAADATSDDAGRHVGCASPDGPGIVGAWRTCLDPEESARALRAVAELHDRIARRERLTAFWVRGAYALGFDAARRGAVAALREWPEAREAVIAAPEPEWPTTGDPLPGVRVPPHGAVVYTADRLPPHIAARLAGVEGVGDAVLVVEYRDPDAPGAGPAEWDSRRAAKRLTAGQDMTWRGIDGTGIVVVHGPQEAHQRPQATPDGGGEPRGDGAPARGLPVAPWWERVRVVAGEGDLPGPALATLFAVSVALGATGMSEPHVEVIDGDVVLTWQSDDVTATVTVRDGGTRTRMWCDDGRPGGSRGRAVEMRTLDLTAPGGIPAWWLDVARRCPTEGPSGRSAAVEGETAPEAAVRR